jgi:hypothetical protein
MIQQKDANVFTRASDPYKRSLQWKYIWLYRMAHPESMDHLESRDGCCLIINSSQVDSAHGSLAVDM